MRYLFVVLLFVAFTSCTQYQKLLKSTDYELKYSKAMEYYEKEDFTRASTLLYDLIGIYRGTEKSQQAHFIYANSLFRMKDYLLAGHYYKTFVQSYPTSSYLEESQFMVAYCFFKQSKNARLDQTETIDALEAFQLFINLYPSSPRVIEATNLMDDLREKLVYKSYLSAKLYFNLGTYMGNNYKSAIIAARNTLDEYPDTEYREELSFLILESKNIMAINSIEELKSERLRDAADEYYAFVNEFPTSQYLGKANQYFETISKLLK